MYNPHFYIDLDEKNIRNDILREGFNPLIISNDPGDIYPEHQHAETKLLVFLKGSMNVKVGDKEFECLPGDKLIVPGNTRHSAIVGREGCTFFWSEKILG